MKFIILAGGSGSRLWPISRDLYPKSLLKLYDGQSLIQNVYKLALSMEGEKNILTVTNTRQLADTISQIKKLCKKPQVIAEPMSKNTASAIAAALYYIQTKRDDTVIILPVDFSVKSVKVFQETINNAVLAAKKGYIVAIGVKPEYPDDGYGYIKTGKSENGVVLVENFVEKPDIQTAESFVKEKNYYWNSGIYVSKISVLLEEIMKYSPQSAPDFSKEMFNEQNSIAYDFYENIPDCSIDCAVMEKTDKLAFVELKTKWQDFGSWKQIYKNSEKDEHDNAIEGNVITDNVHESFVYSSKDLVAVSSIKDTIVVDTEDALLVCDNKRTSDINKLVTKIKQEYDETTQIRKTVIRPWGIYTCLNRGQGWLTKIITVNPHHKLSLQSHNYRSEHWVVLEGEATVTLDDEIITLTKGTSIVIPVKAKHMLENESKEPLKILEVQKGDYIGEDDIIRYKDIYGRIV